MPQVPNAGCSFQNMAFSSQVKWTCDMIWQGKYTPHLMHDKHRASNPRTSGCDSTQTQLGIRRKQQNMGHWKLHMWPTAALNLLHRDTNNCQLQPLSAHHAPCRLQEVTHDSYNLRQLQRTVNHNTSQLPTAVKVPDMAVQLPLSSNPAPQAICSPCTCQQLPRYRTALTIMLTDKAHKLMQVQQTKKQQQASHWTQRKLYTVRS